MTAYKVGDLVTFKIDELNAHDLNNGKTTFCPLSKIIKHEPAPFDWSTVKPGMAFRCGEGARVAIYIGPSPTTKGLIYLADGSILVNYMKQYCVRAPEYDIEVK